MKILIIYYSQSGNTQKIAKRIARGARCGRGGGYGQAQGRRL